MMESAAPRLWVPLSAGILAVMAVAAVLVGLRGGSFPRSVLLPRRMMHQEPVSDFTSGMRFDPNGPDPLTATAIVRGVPTQRMNAPERGFSQVNAAPTCAVVSKPNHPIQDLQLHWTDPAIMNRPSAVMQRWLAGPALYLPFAT